MSDRTKLIVITKDVDDLAEVILLFERTARTLKLVNQFCDVISGQNEDSPDERVIHDALFKFTKQIVANYPEGQAQTRADQETFQQARIARGSQQ